MIENIEQAKERFKKLIDFYKLNDPNNYDYDDRDLISMKLVLEEIERLENIIKEVREYLNKNEIEEVYLDCKLYETEVYKDILEILDKGE